ncbi:MAG: ABC transporter substrate-binding protein [Vicinamibacterales bacterium]
MTRRELLAATLGGFALGTRAVSAAAVTVRDAADRLVTIPKPPQRIVTIFASNTELVAAVGLFDRIVGIDGLTTYPPEVSRIRKVGGRLGFSVDAIVEQNPDLVIVTPARNAMHQLTDPMTRIGVPVIVLMSRDVAEVIRNVRLVGEACSVAERGNVVAATLEQRLAAIKARTTGRRGPSVTMITGRVGTGMLLVAQPNTYTGDAIVLAGGRHALGRAITPQVSPEALWTADPDILLYAGPKSALDELLTRQGWRDMRAIRSQRAHIVSRGELLIPGPRTFDGIEHLAALFDPVRS